MKKYFFGFILNLICVFSVYSMGAPQAGEGPGKASPFITFLPFIFLLGLIVLIVFVEIKIGKAIGSRLSKEAGLIIGILLIILGVTLFIGIPIIIYSNKKKEDEIGQKPKNYEKFVGKNYKDILLENNLGEYINIFTENKLTEIEIIIGLTDSDLEKIGITTLGDRKKILNIFSTE